MDMNLSVHQSFNGPVLPKSLMEPPFQKVLNQLAANQRIVSKSLESVRRSTKIFNHQMAASLSTFQLVAKQMSSTYPYMESSLNSTYLMQNQKISRQLKHLSELEMPHYLKFIDKSKYDSLSDYLSNETRAIKPLKAVLANVMETNNSEDIVDSQNPDIPSELTKQSSKFWLRVVRSSEKFTAFVHHLYEKHFSLKVIVKVASTLYAIDSVWSWVNSRAWPVIIAIFRWLSENFTLF